ncbi:hypothetical protein J7K03_02720 [bacterium]|nr:hypothetical protein [bacterium]
MWRSKRKKQNKRINRGTITKSFLKIFVILLLVALNWQGILAIGRTISYFNDTEDSKGNIYSASTLDFSLRSGQSNFIPPAENMTPGASTARDIYITKLGSLDFKYRGHSEPVDDSCDLDLYNALWLKVWYNWYDEGGTKHTELKYDGLLKNFDDFDTNPDDPDLRIYNSHPYYPNPFYAENEHWLYFQITLPEDACGLQNKSCQFKFVFDGWQPEFSDPSMGFSDREEIFNTVATGDWIPEVTVIYPNGGEIWYMVPDSCPSIPSCSAWCVAHGMNENCQYPIKWTAINKIGSDQDLWINIYYSVDSGNTWMTQIADHTENDGIFWWKIPYNPAYTSDHARIKVEAVHKRCLSLINWDMSDEDFCPPMLSLQEILAMQMDSQGAYNTQSPEDQTTPEITVLPQPTSTQDIYQENISDNSTSTDEGATTTDNQATKDEPASTTEEYSTSTQPVSTTSTSSESETSEPEPQNILLDVPESDSTSTDENISSENAQTTQDMVDESQSEEPDNQTDKNQDKSENNQTESQQEESIENQPQENTQENTQQDLTEEDSALPSEENSIIPQPQKDDNPDDTYDNPPIENNATETENDTNETTE